MPLSQQVLGTQGTCAGPVSGHSFLLHLTEVPLEVEILAFFMEGKVCSGENLNFWIHYHLSLGSEWSHVSSEKFILTI